VEASREAMTCGSSLAPRARQRLRAARGGSGAAVAEGTGFDETVETDCKTGSTDSGGVCAPRHARLVNMSAPPIDQMHAGNDVSAPAPPGSVRAITPQDSGQWRPLDTCRLDTRRIASIERRAAECLAAGATSWAAALLGACAWRRRGTPKRHRGLKRSTPTLLLVPHPEMSPPRVECYTQDPGPIPLNTTTISSGTHGRFRYFPGPDAFLLLNDFTHPAYVLRRE
jgi:hypothetical protein